MEDGRGELGRALSRLDEAGVEELAAVELAAVVGLLDHHHQERAGRRAGEPGQVVQERAQLRRAVLLGLGAEGHDDGGACAARRRARARALRRRHAAHRP